jgi:hypothetical protein
MGADERDIDLEEDIFHFAHSVFVIALIVMAVGSVLITYAISIK